MGSLKFRSISQKPFKLLHNLANSLTTLSLILLRVCAGKSEREEDEFQCHQRFS